MKYTENYNFKKPDYSDMADIPESFNGNFDIIDTELKERDTRVGPLTSLATRIKTSIVNALNGLQADFNEHKAESVSQVMEITRDMSIAGSQIITGFTKQPKRLDIIAFVSGSKKFSFGFCDATLMQFCMARYETDATLGLTTTIAIGTDYDNRIIGTVTGISGNNIEINWTITGTMTGIVQLRINAHYHN